MPDQVAVILSGCGVYDGTEIHEVSAVCVALTRAGKQPVFYAPEKDLFHEVNHMNGADSETSRNVRVESARIARGNVFNLCELQAVDENIMAVIFPGGFGAVKNLCTSAVSSNPTVDIEVGGVLREFHGVGKPIGMCSISPIIAAMVFGKGDGENRSPVKLTLGRRKIKDGETGKWPYATQIDQGVEMGADMVECGVDDVCVDEEYKVVTTPAFMYEGKFHEIYDGINKMVNALLELADVSP